MWKLFFLCGVALLCFSTGASALDRFENLKAADLTVEQLLKMCKPHDGPPQDAFCVGYVAGFVQALHKAESNGLIARACPPEDMTIGQFRSIVEKGIANIRMGMADLVKNPPPSGLPDGAAGDTVYVLLQMEFPCKETLEQNAQFRRLLDTMQRAPWRNSGPAEGKQTAVKCSTAADVLGLSGDKRTHFRDDCEVRQARDSCAGLADGEKLQGTNRRVMIDTCMQTYSVAAQRAVSCSQQADLQQLAGDQRRKFYTDCRRK